MKVLFVYSDVSGEERYGAKKFYSGIASLSAVLKRAGAQTALLYLQREMAREEFSSLVQAHDPAVVAFSATTHQYPYIARYAEYLKTAQPERFAVCGGTHVTLVPDQVMANPAWDAICVGEGEHALLELVECLEQGREYHTVRNLWIRRGAEVVRNPMRPLIENLDELPYFDRDIFDYEALLRANHGWVDMLSGRGCPYDCSYCCNPALKQCFHELGKYVRFRSVAHVMGELGALDQRYAIRTINFQDDTFTLNRRWTIEFCEAYAARFKYPFWINTRVERILDEALVQALAKAHCAGVRIGVENGDPTLRAGVLKRMTSNEEIIAAADLLHSHGIKLYTCNMIGIPGETPASIQATIDLNRRLAPEEFQFSVFYPYPMTELHERCVSESLLKPGAQLSNYYAKTSVLNQAQLSEEQLEHGYESFEALSAELALKRSSPRKYRLYTFLLKLYRGDGARLQRHLSALRRVRRNLLYQDKPR